MTPRTVAATIVGSEGLSRASGPQVSDCHNPPGPAGSFVIMKRGGWRGYGGGRGRGYGGLRRVQLGSIHAQAASQPTSRRRSIR